MSNKLIIASEVFTKTEEKIDTKLADLPRLTGVCRKEAVADAISEHNGYLVIEYSSIITLLRQGSLYQT